MTTSDLHIEQLIDHLEYQLREQIQARHLEQPLIIGIRTGGVWIAELLRDRLGIIEPLGMLDISFYRDDFSQSGMHPNVKPSYLPVDIDGRDLILVDDVFYTGRTIRAALNELFDYGRPHQVLLAVLIERNGKQIPLHPDCIGARIELAQNQRIKLKNNPLAIHWSTLE
jgi:pyrimidine operon attenuation protein/uracil phosphoribosyltransferase